MNASTLICVAAVSCNSTAAPSATLSPETAAPTTASLDKNAVLDTLVKSHIPLSQLKGDCPQVYSSDTAQSLGSIVGGQRQAAETWEAACQPGIGGHSSCVVTLVNNKSEDEEFTAQYRFELDETQALIANSVACVFAG